MKYAVIIIMAIVLSGCVTKQVNSVKSEMNDKTYSKICIVQNPSVEVSDFTMITEMQLVQCGYKTKIVTDLNDKSCTYFLNYSADRNWDLRFYIQNAMLMLKNKDGDVLGSVKYHHGGGFDFSKFKTNEVVISPLVKELLGKNCKQY